MKHVLPAVRGAVLYVEGTAADWNRRIAAGHLAAKTAVRCGLRGVVNEISVDGAEEPPMRRPAARDASLEGKEFDVIVIGAGVIGCAVARELSRYDLRIAVLEKEEDVGVHTSSRNDGMIHPGFAPKPGSKRARYNSRGNRMYTRAARELGFTLRRPGSILLFHTPLMRLLVPLFTRRCRRNGVDGPYRYLSRREVRRREPTVTARQYGGFYMPSAGVVNPFEVTIAYAENAARNGAVFHFGTAAEEFTLETGGETARILGVRTNRGNLRTRAVVNAGGNWADRIAAMAGDGFFSLHGRRGVDLILDRRLGSVQHHILGMPSLLGGRRSYSKGGGLVPCVEGNLLAGPTAAETPERENYATSLSEVEELYRRMALNTAVSAQDVITYFSGVRPASWEEDFIIERSPSVVNLIHLAGIQSPGLASAPAIAEDGARLAVEAVRESSEVRLDPGFDPVREPPVRPAHLPLAERRELIRRRPEYGRIICRCEEISEGEIRDALRSPLHPRSVDAVKRRTRAGAGRCHGGFCLPRIMELMAEELGAALTDITKKGGGSRIAAGQTKTQLPEFEIVEPASVVQAKSDSAASSASSTSTTSAPGRAFRSSFNRQGGG
jgi:glycerol-3-phosphate dehydrogenase